MGGKKIVVICGNIVAEMEGGKNCGNGNAKMGGKKKELWQWSCQKLERKERERERERERENCPNKNIYIFGGVNHLTSSS